MPLTIFDMLAGAANAADAVDAFASATGVEKRRHPPYALLIAWVVVAVTGDVVWRWYWPQRDAANLGPGLGIILWALVTLYVVLATFVALRRAWQRREGARSRLAS